MLYKEWFKSHGDKHKDILKKLTHLTQNEVIEYFRFENMVKNEPNFCYLYQENKKCHKIEDLNCYLCACPYFRFNDEAIKEKNDFVRYSSCSIKAKEGLEFVHKKNIHQDCSQCTIPHKPHYIQKYFSANWFEIMKECQL